jgi:hypothetical protein
LAAKNGRTGRSAPLDTITGILRGYADRAVFRGFSGPVAAGRKFKFSIVWRHARTFELVLDLGSGAGKGKLSFPVLLPRLPANIYREFTAFVVARSAQELPEHRRIDSRKARLATTIRRSDVAVSIAVLDGDYEYAVKKLIHFVQEVFLTFLSPHWEYQVEAFNLDPEGP